MKHLNLDVIGNPPLAPEAAEVLKTWADANPPSLFHPNGEQIRAAIGKARDRIGQLMGGSSQGVVFTASASEALNLAVKGLAWANPRADHIVISGVEHPAVTHSARFLERQGYSLTVLPVDAQGLVNGAHLKDALRSGTALVAVTAASNEIGTLEPLAEIGSICREASVPFVVDGVAAAGRIPLDVEAIRATAVGISGQQLGGPKGVGALWLRPGTRITPLVHGGIQEEGLRAGTENVTGMIAMGAAAAARFRALRAGSASLLRERARTLRDTLQRETNGLVFTGHSQERLPGHVSCHTKVEGEALVLGLYLNGVAASTGSTCSRAGLASPVLKAIGLTSLQARGSLVFSFDSQVSGEDIEYASGVVAREISRLRRMSPRTL